MPSEAERAPRRALSVQIDRTRAARALATAACLAACVLVGACSTLPQNVDRRESKALTDTDNTKLARIAMASRPAAGPAAAGTELDPSISGLELVSRGEEAFGSLYTLISRAERSLDLQSTTSSRMTRKRARCCAPRARAAERGVRVRVLLDDFYTSGEDDRIAWVLGSSEHRGAAVQSFHARAHMVRDAAARIDHRDSIASTGACTTSCSWSTTRSR